MKKIVVIFVVTVLAIFTCYFYQRKKLDDELMRKAVRQAEVVSDINKNNPATIIDTGQMIEKSNISSIQEIDNEYPIEAYINDKDGYTNIRSSPDVNSSILTTVKEGEVFYTKLDYDLNTFWKVKTSSGIIGYMHQSRIQSDDFAYEKYMRSLYKDQDQKEKNGSTKKSGNEKLADALGDMLDIASGQKKQKFKEKYVCKWCGNEFKTKNGWFHNNNYAQGEIGCMEINDFIYAGYPKYCSKRCCSNDN